MNASSRRDTFAEAEQNFHTDTSLHASRERQVLAASALSVSGPEAGTREITAAQFVCLIRDPSQ
jgi:hypothetical protein